MRVHFVFFVCAMALMLAAASVTPAAGQPLPQQTGGNVPITNAGMPIQSAAEIYAYWTPQRMAEANANPMPLGMVNAQPGSPSLSAAPTAGPAQSIPGAAPLEP